MRRVGAHLSIAGGIYKAVESVVEKGGNALQIFSSSPRMWQGKFPCQKEIDKFNDLVKKHKVSPVVIHAKYLVNLASDKKELVKKSRESILFDFRLAKKIKAMGVVVHLGSHQGRGFEAVKGQLAGEIKSILGQSRSDCMFLIENAAQKKGKIGKRLEEISWLLQAVHSSRLGWCLDTCHGYSAGYFCGFDLGKQVQGFDIVKSLQKLNLSKQLKCLHVNDSRNLFDSGQVQHANLGEGKMGKAELKAYVNNQLLKHLPLIIETPGFKGEGPDKKNLDILKSWLK